MFDLQAAQKAAVSISIKLIEVGERLEFKSLVKIIEFRGATRSSSNQPE